jgi:hypothetical protein
MTGGARQPGGKEEGFGSGIRKTLRFPASANSALSVVKIPDPLWSLGDSKDE